MTEQGTDQQTVPVCYRHPGRESWIRCTRCDRPICPDCMREAPVGFQCPECVGAAHRGERRPRTVYGGRLSARSGQVTLVLIGLNVVAYLLKLAAGSGTTDAHFALYSRVLMPDGSLGGVAEGEYYRLVTSMFLHVSLIHIALNMYLLYLLGPPLEQMLGRTRFVGLYLGSGLGGAALSYLSNQGGEGASGAIFGLFAAFYIFTRRLGRDTSQITLLIVLNLVFSFVFPGIGYWAHIGGLVAGALIGLGYAYAPAGPARPAVQSVGVLAVLVAVAGITAAHTAALA